MEKFLEQAMAIWSSGGWLMMPLFVLTVFIYYTALELFIRVSAHFLVRRRVHRWSDAELTGCLDGGGCESVRQLLLAEAYDVAEVKRHFVEVRNEYLPIVNRRIKSLGVIITAGPLMGLLGTVTGMLSTFSGMIAGDGTKFESVVTGISEALITTQTGLVISIPAFVILSLIVQRRNTLESAIARLERFNTCLVLRTGLSDSPGHTSEPERAERSRETLLAGSV